MLSNLLLAGPPVITSEPDYVRDPGLGTAIPVVRRSVVIDEVEVNQINLSPRGLRPIGGLKRDLSISEDHSSFGG